MTQNEIFAKNLNKYLDLRGERQLDLASAIGVSQAAVSGWCSGAKVPKMDRIAKICSHFGCEFVDLLGEQNPTDDKHFLFLYEQLSAEGKEQAVDYICYMLQKERGKK